MAADGLLLRLAPPLTRAQFVADGVFFAELNELLVRELAEDGYSGVEVRQTPMRTEIIIRATRTQNVLGEWWGCDGGCNKVVVVRMEGLRPCLEAAW